MYKCNICKTIFDEPESRKICLEVEYGVASLFDNMNYAYISVCPVCDSNDFEEVEQCLKCGGYYNKYKIENDICEECKEKE